MALGQGQEGTLRGPDVFLRRLAAQPLEALPMNCFLCLLLTPAALGFGASQHLHMLGNDADACPRRLDAAAKHLPAFTPGPAQLLRRLLDYLLPMCQCLGERVRAVLLAAEIAEGAAACFSLLVAVALDQVVAARVAGTTENDESHARTDTTAPLPPQAATDTTGRLNLVPVSRPSGVLGRVALLRGVCTGSAKVPRAWKIGPPRSGGQADNGGVPVRDRFGLSVVSVMLRSSPATERG